MYHSKLKQLHKAHPQLLVFYGINTVIYEAFSSYIKHILMMCILEQ